MYRLYGSYENLEAGQTSDALIDMSGGLQEQFDLKNISAFNKANLWMYLDKGFQQNTLMGCCINVRKKMTK